MFGKSIWLSVSRVTVCRQGDPIIYALIFKCEMATVNALCNMFKMQILVQIDNIVLSKIALA